VGEEYNNSDELSLNIDDSEIKSNKGFILKLKQKLSLKIMIIIGSVLSLLIGVIILGLVFSGGETKEAKFVERNSQETSVMRPIAVFFDDIVKFDPIEIKLGDMGGEKSFKVGVSFKIDQQGLRDELLRKDEQVIEIISALLQSKTYAELEDADGKILLRNEIIKNLNEMLETGHIVNLFFYEYLIL
jgi:flagellar FliL protein